MLKFCKQILIMRFPKKSLGQHYLIDRNIIRKIIDTVKINNRDVIEIGPGKGALTEEILKRKPKSLTLIEKDDGLSENLKLKYFDINLLKIFNADILKFNLEKIIKKDTVVFGNLPYNISSQILVKILRFNIWPPQFKDLVFMFQKELGEKIVCKYPSPKYGRLSILRNYRLDIDKSFNVSSNCFFPKPKVSSMVIHFKPKKNLMKNIKKLENLEKVTNIFFSGKRKMINKNIKKVLSKSDIDKIHAISLSKRPSEVKPEIYYKITELFEKRSVN